MNDKLNPTRAVPGPSNYNNFQQFGTVLLASAPIAALHILAGPSIGTWVLFTIDCKNVVVGPGQNAHIRICDEREADDLLSQKYFAFSIVPTRGASPIGDSFYKAIILGLATSTLTLNQAPLGPHTSYQLHHGDEIRVDDSLMVFHSMQMPQIRDRR